MEILGIGPLELLLILIIALVVVGPNELVTAGATVGKFIRRFRRSETWRGFQRVSHSLRTLPEDLARQSGLDEMRKEIQASTRFVEDDDHSKISDMRPEFEAWTQPPADKEIKPEKSDTSTAVDQE